VWRDCRENEPLLRSRFPNRSREAQKV